MVQIASGSLVLCVHELERLAREGVDFDEAVARANTFLERTKILFALSSFDNLIKNGRMGKMTGFLELALQAKRARLSSRAKPEERKRPFANLLTA